MESLGQLAWANLLVMVSIVVLVLQGWLQRDRLNCD